MTLPEGIRRHSALVALLSAALIALGAASATSAYTHVDRMTVHQERTDWSERAAYTYVVPVERNSTLWPNGTILPMGMPAYYRTITQNVTALFSWSPDAPHAGGAANASMTLRVRAETPDGRAYWTFERPLATASAAQPENLTLALQGTLDLDALVNDVSRVLRELPLGEGHVNWTIVTDVDYELAAGGTGNSTFVFPFDVSDPRILLPAPSAVAWDPAHTTPHDVTLASQAGWVGVLASLPSLAALGAGAAGLTLVVWATRVDPGRGRSARDAAFHREHAQHVAWVTVSGPLNERALPSVVVDVPSLEQLVETAADARTRVVLDARRRVYYALTPTVAYRYARHAKRRPLGKMAAR